MKRTIDLQTGERFAYDEVVFYLGYNVPGRTTKHDQTQLAPSRVEPKLFAELNPGKKQPTRGQTATARAIIARLQALRWHARNDTGPVMATKRDVENVLAIIREEGLTTDWFIELDERPGQYDCKYGEWFWKLRRIRNAHGRELFMVLKTNTDIS